MPARARAALVWLLSVPTILAELSSIAMEYIDAGMVGRIGSGGAAAIGLVASTTWLCWAGLRGAAAGYSVLVAQRIGAGRDRLARSTALQGLRDSLVWAALLGAAGAAVSGAVPRWLGGAPELRADASSYLLVFMLGMPLGQLRLVCSRYLLSAGDMRTSSALNVLACALDVVFNFLLIFPSRAVSLAGLSVPVPGAGLGVVGAALGTVAADAVTGALLARAVFARNPHLRLRAGDAFRSSRAVLARAVRIGAPVGLESVVITGAMVAATAIVAPLGTVALAANSFAITAESLCYMPGYGISSAATALVGQAIGAGRPRLARALAWTCTRAGVAVMAATGALLYAFAPQAMALLSPDPDVVAAGAEVLRIEAFAEPLFAASIVAAGALRGAGDTLGPGVLNAASVWCVRIPLAALLVARGGLRGAWIAMAAELSVRGLLLLARLASGRWDRPRPARAR
ncbi:MAG: MATE family efflux transporter [Kiritimatiellae bacterium]|nr:MATE family efflux transporter [Kiritimatiellia bacterium]